MRGPRAPALCAKGSTAGTPHIPIPTLMQSFNSGGLISAQPQYHLHHSHSSAVIKLLLLLFWPRPASAVTVRQRYQEWKTSFMANSNRQVNTLYWVTKITWAITYTPLPKSLWNATYSVGVFWGNSSAIWAADTIFITNASFSWAVGTEFSKHYCLMVLSQVVVTR